MIVWIYFIWGFIQIENHRIGFRCTYLGNLIHKWRRIQWIYHYWPEIAEKWDLIDGKGGSNARESVACVATRQVGQKLQNSSCTHRENVDWTNHCFSQSTLLNKLPDRGLDLIGPNKQIQSAPDFWDSETFSSKIILYFLGALGNSVLAGDFVVHRPNTFIPSPFQFLAPTLQVVFVYFIHLSVSCCCLPKEHFGYKTKQFIQTPI